MAPDYLLLAFGRATVFTSASAIVAWLLLRSARVGSPKIHRAAWFLVVAQGWLLFPWVWQIEMPSTEPNAVIATIERTTNASLPFNTAISINESQSDVGTPLTWEHIALAISVVWFFGAALIALSRTLQYVRFVRRVRDSNADTDAHWNWEWQRQLRATRIRQRVELRMTGE